jgi:hypothetical protein
MRRKIVPVIGVGLLATACGARPHKITQSEAVNEAARLNREAKAHGLCAKYLVKQPQPGEWKVVYTEAGCPRQSVTGYFGDLSTTLEPGRARSPEKDRESRGL